MKVLFASLSTIRNLSLPGACKTPIIMSPYTHHIFYINIAAHKSIFFKEGVVEKVSNTLLEAADPSVVMKAVGCLRLLSVTTGRLFNIAVTT